MSTAYATLTDTVTLTSVQFYMKNGWKPSTHRVGALYYPLGNPVPTQSTDGNKGLGGTFDIISTSPAMDANVYALVTSLNPLTLTLPDGRAFTIQIDPATDPQGDAQFSLWNWRYLNIWTVKYYQAA